jgi:putative oxidoreductase
MTGVQPILALLGRILIAAVFLWSGYGKVTDFANNVGYAASFGMPVPQLAIILGAVVELLGSTLLIIGFQVRLVAFIMAGFAIVTALVFHRNFADFEQELNFMKNLSIAGGLLQIAALGGGAYSIDGRRG